MNRASITPRPIAWVSTVSADGVPDLARGARSRAGCPISRGVPDLALGVGGARRPAPDPRFTAARLRSCGATVHTPRPLHSPDGIRTQNPQEPSRRRRYCVAMSTDRPRPPVITSSELLARGYSRRAREHAERTGQLYRVRHGVYVPAAELPTAPGEAEAMLEMRSRASARFIRPGTVMSHTSALVLHGLPAQDLDTRRVTTTRHRPGSGSRRGESAICHSLDLGDAVTEVEGIPVTTPARTIVDVARTSPFTGAVCAADEALRRALCTRAELAAELDAAAGRVGIARARAVVAFADPGGHSVLESLSRVAISRAGLPMPQLQHEFVLPDGSRTFVDMYWKEWGLVGESDGSGNTGSTTARWASAGNYATRRTARTRSNRWATSSGDGNGRTIDEAGSCPSSVRR